MARRNTQIHDLRDDTRKLVAEVHALDLELEKTQRRLREVLEERHGLEAEVKDLRRKLNFGHNITQFPSKGREE